MNLKNINNPFTQIPQCLPSPPSQIPIPKLRRNFSQIPPSLQCQSITNQNITYDLINNCNYNTFLKRTYKSKPSFSLANDFSKQHFLNKSNNICNKLTKQYKLSKTRKLYGISSAFSQINQLNVIREESLSIEGKSQFSSKVNMNSTYLLLKESKLHNNINSVNNSNTNSESNNNTGKKFKNDFENVESHFYIELLGKHREKEKFNKSNEPEKNYINYATGNNNTIEKSNQGINANIISKNRKGGSNNVSINNNNISTNREMNNIYICKNSNTNIKNKGNNNNLIFQETSNLHHNTASSRRKKFKRYFCCLPYH